jgi:hypothetical protein
MSRNEKSEFMPHKPNKIVCPTRTARQNHAKPNAAPIRNGSGAT